MSYAEHCTVQFLETLADNVFRYNYSIMQIWKAIELWKIWGWPRPTPLSGAFFNQSAAITTGSYTTRLTYFRCYILLIIFIYFRIFFSILSLTCQLHSSIYSYDQGYSCLSIILSSILVIVVCVCLIPLNFMKINPLQKPSVEEGQTMQREMNSSPRFLVGLVLLDL